MDKTKPGLCILLTNTFMRSWTGSELYIRDVALELIRRGHKPVVYSPRTGRLAEALRQKSIWVVSDLDQLGVQPDLIHGQHHLETMTALARFPDVPAVYFSHGWLAWEEKPPRHPRILKYVAVSDTGYDCLVYECGIPAGEIEVILNSVDLERFQPRPPLPPSPGRALVFHNKVATSNILEVIREACSRRGVKLDVIGSWSGKPTEHPETLLGKYDIIFGLGRSALEGMATGAAVICCGPEGAGEMVTTQNFDRLRRQNFGLRALDKPLTVETLQEQIGRYDAPDALKISQKVREAAGLHNMVDQVLEVYGSVLERWAAQPVQDREAENLAYSAYLRSITDKFYRESEITRKFRDSLPWKLISRVYRFRFVQNFVDRTFLGPRD